MPGGTFLPIAGPIGSALGLALGALIMMVIGANYHYLMNRFPDNGGTYTYTTKSFGASKKAPSTSSYHPIRAH